MVLAPNNYLIRYRVCVNVNLFTNEAGSIYGLNTLQEYLNDPTSFSSPRNVRFGVNLDF